MSLSSQIRKRDEKQARREKKRKNSWSGKWESFLDNYPAVAKVGGVLLGITAIAGLIIAARAPANNESRSNLSSNKSLKPTPLTHSSTNTTHQHLNNQSNANVTLSNSRGNNSAVTTPIPILSAKVAPAAKNESASIGVCLSDKSGMKTLDPFHARKNAFNANFPDYFVKGFGGATKMAKNIDLRNEYCNGADIDPASLTQSITFHAGQNAPNTYYMTFLLAITNKTTHEVTYVTDTSYVHGFAQGTKNVQTGKHHSTSIIVAHDSRITSNDFKYIDKLLKGESLPLRYGSWALPQEDVIEKNGNSKFLLRNDHPTRMKKQLDDCLSKPRNTTSRYSVWCNFDGYEKDADNYEVRLADPSELSLQNQVKAKR